MKSAFEDLIDAVRPHQPAPALPAPAYDIARETWDALERVADSRSFYIVIAEISCRCACAKRVSHAVIVQDPSGTNPPRALAFCHAHAEQARKLQALGTAIDEASHA